MRKYARLRKEVLGLDKMLYCDIEAPLDPEFEPETTWEEASDIIINALSVLGPEYTEIMKNALENRWVDRADNLGKRTGRFVLRFMESIHISASNGITASGQPLPLPMSQAAGQGVLAQRYQSFSNTRPPCSSLKHRQQSTKYW